MLMRCGWDAAVGCATPAMPEHGWVERGTSDTAIVGCNFTRQRWYLHCVGRQWVGDSRNCSVIHDLGMYAHPTGEPRTFASPLYGS